MKSLVKCPFCHGKGLADPLKGYDWDGLLRYWVKIGLTLAGNVTLSQAHFEYFGGGCMTKIDSALSRLKSRWGM